MAFIRRLVQPDLHSSLPPLPPLSRLAFSLFRMMPQYEPAVQHIRDVALQWKLPLLDMARVPEMQKASPSRYQYVQPDPGGDLWLHQTPRGSDLWYNELMRRVT